MSNEDLDESKDKIITEIFNNKNKEAFKGLKIQAGPGTGKTYLLRKIISRLIKEGLNDTVCVLSFSNSTIDTITNKLDKNENIETSTIASFFIENFIIPFSCSILEKEPVNWKQKTFLRKISNDFTEQYMRSNDWSCFHHIVEKYGDEDRYFDVFYNLLLQKGIKYIFIDEFQDTKKYCKEIFNKIIKKGKIKFICVGDKNQQINCCRPLKKLFDGLDSSNCLKTTYRFGEKILEEVEKIDGLTSGIKNCKQKRSGNIKHLDCQFNGGFSYKKIEKQCNYIKQYILDNEDFFIEKNNVILFQPTTDNKDKFNFGHNFNNTLKQVLSEEDKIKFSYTEKPIYNIHLKLFVEKAIGFVNGKISYGEIEKELNFFYKKGDNNYKNLFFELLKLNKSNTIIKIKNLLNRPCFKDNIDSSSSNYKSYFDEIVNNLEKKDISFQEAEGKRLIELLDMKKEANKIYISTNTIMSSKGKEYDNVFVLNCYKQYGLKSFGERIKNDCSEAKRNYYVAISRAKENVFTFLNYDLNR